MLHKNPQVNLVLVHGMCTHDKGWADDAMKQVVRAIDSNLPPPTDDKSLSPKSVGPGIEVVDKDVDIRGSKLQMTALIWSPLTTPLKRQLDFDITGTPTDCATAEQCKPTRAKVNAVGKDVLLNDCLADALIYQGESREVIRSAMVKALEAVLDKGPADTPLALVSDSLGSKIVFDALAEMLGNSNPKARAAAARLEQIFMNANQLPILGLADQKMTLGPATGLQPMALAPPVPPTDSLRRFLALRPPLSADKSTGSDKLTVVAFTDPNDLLSYRLMPSRYPMPNVQFADVLVSNTTTYFGLLSRPDHAHLHYMSNPEVATMISCGSPKSTLCK